MNAVRTLLVVFVLGAVGYGAYVSFSAGPDPEPPLEAGGDWGQAPKVEMAGPSAATASPDRPTVIDAVPSVAGGEPDPSTASPLGTQPPGGPSQLPSWGGGASDARGDISRGDGAPLRAGEGDPAQGAAASGHAGSARMNSLRPEASTESAGGSSGAAGSVQQADWTTGGSNGVHSTEGAGAAESRTGTAEPPTDDEVQRMQAAMDRVQKFLDEERLADALRELTPFYNDQRLGAPQLVEVLHLLDQLAGTVIFDFQQHLLEPAYTMQEGERLEAVATRYKVPWQLLAKINGISDPAALPPGEQIKVVRGPFHAVVDLRERQLVLFLDRIYAVRFGLATPPDDNLQAGVFRVRSKRETAAIDPYSPGAPSGTAGEPAGKWLELDGGQRIQADGESPFVTRAGRNSILVSSKDMGDLFDMLAEGSSVEILR